MSEGRIRSHSQTRRGKSGGPSCPRNRRIEYARIRIAGGEPELWIDDFGAGHANLSYLQRLTCNVVKIDRGFLDQHDKRRELLGGMIFDL
ncbi:MAG TPA: EAL domain-containing protein, partial [Bradyrhizobium sp.]|nr:EAL domain-containing protein [Bradyrhizobium sp.]